MKLEELGKVITTDVLIIGGGLAGISTAIFAKETNPNLEVMVLETQVAGYAGQSTKAGHGIFCVFPDMSVDSYVNWAVRVGGDYLNDQVLLRQYGEESYKSIQILKDWGCTLGVGYDGTFLEAKVPAGNFGGTGCDNDVALHARNKALELGVIFKNYTQGFDFLKDGDRVVGAIGMNLQSGEFYIFKAKAVAIATSACHYKVSGMFKGYGDAIAAAYEAGAEMRNAEFFTQCDIIDKNTGDKIYGCHDLLFNKDGENLTEKYAPGADEVTYPLIFGMKKEIEAGKDPLYVDLTIHSDHLDTVGMNVKSDPETGALRIGPSKERWLKHIGMKQQREGKMPNPKPEASITFTMTTSPVSVDHEMKTTVPGLWAVGACSYWGQAYMGWIHGDGVGNAVKSAMHAGPSLAKYATEAEFGMIDAEQVEAFKEKLYAPMNREDGVHPQFYFDRIGTMVTDFDYSIAKTEKTMNEALDKIEEIRADLPKIGATDWHELAKCREVEGMLTCAQLAYTASRERKESRGYVWRHNRIDYPETNNKEWLKYVVLKKGDNGQMDIRFDPIPIDEYEVKPNDL